MYLFTFQSAIDYFIAYMKINAIWFYKRQFVYKTKELEKRDTLTFLDMNAGPEYPFYY